MTTSGVGQDPFTAHRADGWPLCPRCGEDELWSTFTPQPPDSTGTLEQYRAVPRRRAALLPVQLVAAGHGELGMRDSEDRPMDLQTVLDSLISAEEIEHIMGQSPCLHGLVVVDCQPCLVYRLTLRQMELLAIERGCSAADATELARTLMADREPRP